MEIKDQRDPIEIAQDADGFYRLPNLPIGISPNLTSWGGLLALNLVFTVQRMNELAQEVKDLRQKIQQMEADE